MYICNINARKELQILQTFSLISWVCNISLLWTVWERVLEKEIFKQSGIFLYRKVAISTWDRLIAFSIDDTFTFEDDSEYRWSIEVDNATAIEIERWSQL